MPPDPSSPFDPASTRVDTTLTVYYDGACPVCSREIAAYRRQPGADRCVWIDASSCDDAALGTGLSRDIALGRFHVRRADGVLVDGMRGFALLWRALPRLAWLGRIASIGPLPLLLDAAYRVFLKVRVLWQSARTVPTSRSSRPAPPIRGDESETFGPHPVRRPPNCTTHQEETTCTTSSIPQSQPEASRPSPRR